MAEKLDWKKEFKKLYFPPAQPVLVDVPTMHFLMLDGHGDPNHSQAYQEVVEALFSVSYTLKFLIKKEMEVDYAVFPLEGLWWVEDMAEFSVDRKDEWDWTMMIAQPETVTAAWVEQARRDAMKKKTSKYIEQVRFEPYAEGLCAQVMHTGPYADEGPTIARLHAFLREQGGVLAGKHHEIYLSDVRRTAPEKLKTVIRQPMTE